jgi:hypothetical protein
MSMTQYGGGMKTERRDTPRIPITLEAILSFNNINYQSSITRDISLDGVFVETRRLPPIDNVATELAIKIPTDGRDKYHRFHAQIVRHTGHGVGCSFDMVDTDAYAALLDLVFSRQRRGAI